MARVSQAKNKPRITINRKKKERERAATSYPHCAIRFLRAMAIARFDDERATVGKVRFLQSETVKVAVDVDARAARFGHVSNAFPPCH